MELDSNAPRKKLLEYLPAIYQESGPPGRPNYLPALLEPFEEILLGREEKPRVQEKSRPAQEKNSARAVEGLHEKISRLHELFDPWETPVEFLPWLASWAALSLRSTLRSDRKRTLIANIIPLYRIRGTRSYLEQLLALCVDAPTSVSEAEIPALQLGTHSTVGSDMYIGGGSPHYFRVTLVASDLSALEVQAQRQLAYEVVELAKPAHTGYEFQVISPEMQVGVHSTVGQDTVLGATDGSASTKGV